MNNRIFSNLQLRFWAIVVSLFSIVPPSYGQEFSFPPDVFDNISTGNDIKSASLPGAGTNSNGYGDQLPETAHTSWSDMVSNPSTWSSRYSFPVLHDLVRVAIDYDKTPPATGYKYRFTFVIQQYNDPASPSTYTTSSAILDLEYDPAAGQTYKDISVHKFSNCHSFKVFLDKVETINANGTSGPVVPRSALADNFFIKTEVSCQKYDFVAPQYLLTQAAAAANGSRLNVSWGFAATNSSGCNLLNTSMAKPPRPVLFEIEWIYIDDYQYNIANQSASYAFAPGSTLNTMYSFKNNATRVRTYNYFYSIPLVYEHGLILYRVRALQPDASFQKLNVFKDWTLAESGTVNLSPSCLPASGYLVTQPQESDKLNWQYSIAFSEEAKYKHSINYFDGVGKNRQNLTWLNSQNSGGVADNVVVQENIYDREGRPSIKTLPVPVATGNVNYIPNLTTINGGQPLTAATFDVPSAACSPAALPPLDASSLANKYYSPSNPDQSGMQQYVPNANGYPYVQSIYSPDNTDKLRWQGGAGSSLQPWNGHALQYDHVRADQVQLNRLLGSEAGKAEFYPKEIVTDQNGQNSFTIYNPDGKVAVTGLSGYEPSLDNSAFPIDKLASRPASPTWVTKELLKDVQPQLLGGKVYQNGSFYTDVHAPSGASVTHSATITSYQLCGNDLMPQLKYTTRIMDNCGAIKYPTSGLPYEGTVGSWGATPSVLPPLSATTTVSNQAIPNLNRGKYIVESAVHINEQDLRNQVTGFFDTHKGPRVFNTCFLNEQEFIYDKIISDTYPCSPGEGVPTNDCEALKRELMKELWPGEKYGISLPDLIIYPVQKRSIFSIDFSPNLPAVFMQYQSPCITLPHPITIGGISYSSLQNVPGQLLIDNFNDTIAEALLPLHPEYCRLQACDHYSDDINAIKSYAEAQSQGRNTLAGLLAGDPLNPANNPSSTIALNDLKFISSGGQQMQLDDFALLQFYCGDANGVVSVHCSQYVYANEIQNKIVPADPVKADQYWLRLKAIYTGNRNFHIYKKITQAGDSCGPCKEWRLQLSGDPVLPDVLNGNVNQYLDSNDLQFPADLVNAFNNPSSATTLPVSAQDDELQAHHDRCDQFIADIFDKLKNCGVVPGSLNETVFTDQMKTVLSYNDPSLFTELTPAQVDAAMAASGISRNDLCHAFLVDYASVNNYAARAASRGLVCKDGAFYDAFKAFLARPQVWSAINGTGSSNFVTLSASNIFEAQLVTAIAGSTTNMTVYMTVGIDVVNLPSGSVNVRKLAFSIAGGTPVSLYFDKSILNTSIQVTTVQCQMDGSAMSSQLAHNSVILQFDNGQKVACWIDRIPLLNDAQSMNSENTLTCVDALNGFNAFKADAGAWKYDNRANHPLFGASVANYLNFKFKRNFTSSEYEGLMQGCALSDKTVVNTHKATYKVELPASAAQAFYDFLTQMNDRHIEFHNFYLSGKWHFYIDMNSVNPKDLLTLKVQIFTASGASFTDYPATPAATSNALIIGNSAWGSFAWNGLSYAGQLVPCGNPASPVNKMLFTIPINPSSAQSIANDLVNLNAGVNVSLPGASILSDFKLYRSSDYSLAEKQSYLNHIYGLPANYTRDQVVYAVAPSSLNSLYPGKVAAYDETFCTDKNTDLYLADDNAAHVRLNYIVQQVNNYTGNRPFNFSGNYTVLATSPSSYGNELVAIRNSDGSFWFRYFDQSRNLYNLYVLPPKEAYNLAQCTFNAYSILPSYDGEAQAVRFAVNGANGLVYECKAYFTGAGFGAKKLQQVVLQTPVTDQPCFNPNNCERNKLLADIQDGLSAFDQYRSSTIEKNTGLYAQHLAATTTTALSVTVPDMSYHFTLYYYDQAGNLIRTVSPAGQQPLNVVSASIDQARKDVDLSMGFAASNDKVNKYRYNSRNQVIWQHSVDGGDTYFFYDAQGRPVFSQNSKQRPRGRYSYTLYDELSRIEETGEVILDQTPAPAPADPTTFTLNTTNYVYNGVLQPFAFYPYVEKVEEWSMDQIKTIVRQKPRENIVRTLYDHPIASSQSQNDALWKGNGQHNVRNRVSSIQFYSGFSSPNWPVYTFATHFSYDVVGNVKTLIQDYPALENLQKRYTRVDYDYDLASGKVNALSYNRGYADQFYHRYAYDADNRLTKVETSNDGLIWDRDAAYEYYKHGPLARTQLGDIRVQSLEYAYTIQGWLKAINGQLLRPDNDMGQNGLASPGAYPKDVLAHSLDYFNGDYSPIGAGNLPNQPLPLAASSKSLYNGNIVRQSTGIVQASAQLQDLVRNYQYDQLHRLTAAANQEVQVSGSGSGASYTLNAVPQYGSEYSYDADGNILTLKRKEGSGAWIDQLTYNYTANRNTLNYVSDASPATASPDDIDNQAAGNYQYDGAGNLISDAATPLGPILWNHYGKVTSIRNNAQSKTLLFSYDGMGHRIVKDVVTGGQTHQSWNGEYYVRDAQGNILASYKTNAEWDAQALYQELFGVLGPVTGGKKVIAETGLQYGQVSNLYYGNLTNSGNSAWILARAAEYPVSVVLKHNTEAYNQFLGASRHYLDSLFREGNDSVLIAALSAVINESDQQMLGQVLQEREPAERTLGYLCQVQPQYTTALLDKMGQQPHSSNCDSTAVQVWSVYHTEQAIPDLASMVTQFLAGDPKTTYDFYTLLVHDTAVIPRGAMDSVLVQVLNEEEIDKETVLGYFDEWPAARGLLNTAVPAGLQGGALFGYAAPALVERYIGDFGTTDLEQTLAHGAVVPPNLFISHAKIIAGSLGLTDVEITLDNQTTATAIASQQIALAEHHIYGSSRLGIKSYPAGELFNRWEAGTAGLTHTSLSTVKPWLWRSLNHLMNSNWQVGELTNGYHAALNSSRMMGRKQYELSDHLGNVLATVLDRKLYQNSQWTADVAGTQDYYPFGMLMPGRNYSTSTGDYRFGFNGQQKDNEVAGVGNHLDFKFRGYDSRLGRFWSVDPLSKNFPWWSSYQFAGNTPIAAVDLEGSESKIIVWENVGSDSEPDLHLRDYRNVVPPGPLGNGTLETKYKGSGNNMVLEYDYHDEAGNSLGAHYSSFNPSEDYKAGTAERILSTVFKPLLNAGNTVQRYGDEQFGMTNEEWYKGESWEGQGGFEKHGWPTMKATWGVLGVLVGSPALALEFSSLTAAQSLTATTLYGKTALLTLNSFSAAESVRQAAGGTGNPVSVGVDMFNQFNDAVDAAGANPISIFNTAVTMHDYYMQYGGSPSANPPSESNQKEKGESK